MALIALGALTAAPVAAEAKLRLAHTTVQTKTKTFNVLEATDPSRARNDIVVRQRGPNLIIRDRAGIAPLAPGCSYVGVGMVSCPRAGIHALLIWTGPGNDVVRIRNIRYPRLTLRDVFGSDRIMFINVHLGPGNDRFFGGWGTDFVTGGRGNDSIRGGPGPDVLVGGTGRDRLWGGAGNDYLDGGPGPDRLFGGRGHDLLFGGPGNDALFGGPGADRFFGGSGFDRCYGGAGADRQIGCQIARGIPHRIRLRR